MYKHGKRPFGVVIGRFQPFHNGHKHLVLESLKTAKKLCIVLGSARHAPCPKNPWTPKMREEMIRACFTPEENERLVFTSVRDYRYNNTMWFTDVRNKVLSALDCSDVDINIYGYFKDQSSWYLKSFPNWQIEEVSPSKPIINATDVRADYFENLNNQKWAHSVPDAVIDYLHDYAATPIYSELKKEYDYYKDYKQATKFVGTERTKSQSWSPTFLTADAVVIQSGHVLVIKRGVNPGKGLLAIPGGFLNQNETLEQAALRELKEETEILMPQSYLKAAIKEGKLFDSPDRSLRGRTVTYAICIHLPDDLERGLPKVKGSDDASGAFWMPISDMEAREDEFFEDHLDILRYFIRKI